MPAQKTPSIDFTAQFPSELIPIPRLSSTYTRRDLSSPVRKSARLPQRVGPRLAVIRPRGLHLDAGPPRFLLTGIGCESLYGVSAALYDGDL